MAALKLTLSSPVAGRLPVLDELKGLAISLVILYHAGGVLGMANFFHGDVGVDIFVILSGIGLALGAQTESARSFLTRRLLRIFPTYWIALTLFWLCNSHFLQKEYTSLNVALHYLGIHGWFGDQYAMGIVDSFWFVTLIVSLYALFCLLRRWLAAPDRLLLVGAAISVTVALVLFFTRQSGSFAHLGMRMPGFFVGLLIGRLLKNGELDLRLGAALALAVFLVTYVPYTQGIIFHSVAVGLCLMGVYAWLWKTVAPVRVETSVARVLKFLGDHSLEIFLFHQPLIRDYNVYLHGRWFNLNAPTSASLLVGMIIGLAITLFVSVELRALLRKIPALNRASP